MATKETQTEQVMSSHDEMIEVPDVDQLNELIPERPGKPEPEQQEAESAEKEPEKAEPAKAEKAEPEQKEDKPAAKPRDEYNRQRWQKMLKQRLDAQEDARRAQQKAQELERRNAELQQRLDEMEESSVDSHKAVVESLQSQAKSLTDNIRAAQESQEYDKAAQYTAELSRISAELVQAQRGTPKPAAKPRPDTEPKPAAPAQPEQTAQTQGVDVSAYPEPMQEWLYQNQWYFDAENSGFNQMANTVFNSLIESGSKADDPATYRELSKRLAVVAPHLVELEPEIEDTVTLPSDNAPPVAAPSEPGEVEAAAGNVATPSSTPRPVVASASQAPYSSSGNGKKEFTSEKRSTLDRMDLGIDVDNPKFRQAYLKYSGGKFA